LFGTAYVGSASQISCTNRVKAAVKLSLSDPASADESGENKRGRNQLQKSLVWLLVSAYFGHKQLISGTK